MTFKNKNMVRLGSGKSINACFLPNGNISILFSVGSGVGQKVLNGSLKIARSQKDKIYHCSEAIPLGAALLQIKNGIFKLNSGGTNNDL